MTAGHRGPNPQLECGFSSRIQRVGNLQDQNQPFIGARIRLCLFFQHREAGFLRIGNGKWLGDAWGTEA